MRMMVLGPGPSSQAEVGWGLVRLSAIIWDKSTNPTDYVSDQLGIERWQLRTAIHKIKASNNLHGPDRVIIYDDGDVTDENGSQIGNIFDEI
ncbi:MAG: hypothetical protein ACJ8DU_00045 [Microvirga sp.]|nr:hypothetical protein [Beijerinckiaceae bacterium]